MQKQRAGPGRGEGTGQGHAQQRVQRARAASSDLFGAGGQPRAGGARGGGGQVLDERGAPATRRSPRR
ncbi:hypothetical protein ABZ871_40530 [Streptomyces populi]